MDRFIEYILKKIHIEKRYSIRVREEMQKLVAPLQVEKSLFSYYKKQVKILMLVFFAGFLLSGMVFIEEGKQKQIIKTDQQEYIVRDSQSNLEKKVDIIANLEGEEEQLSLIVEPQKLTPGEFDVICKDLENELPGIIQGENIDLEHVTEDLNFIESYGPHSIFIQWDLEDYTYIHSDGSIDKEQLRELKEPLLVEVRAHISYEDYEKIISFPIQLVKYVEDNQMEIWSRLSSYLKEEQIKQRNTDQFIFPKGFEGKALSVKEKSKNNSFLLLFLTFLAGIAIYFGSERELHKETENRREQLLNEYPEFVSKLSLFIGAGMTTKAAFYQLCRDYARLEKEKNYLGYELNYMLHEIENGINEARAYEDFGKRCGLGQYRKLMALLIQNNKKGSANLLKLLEQEANDYFETKKSIARRKGEKAGTKLLLPMSIMLGIVMIIIIIPAFLSYEL